MLERFSWSAGGLRTTLASGKGKRLANTNMLMRMKKG